LIFFISIYQHELLLCFLVNFIQPVIQLLSIFDKFSFPLTVITENQIGAAFSDNISGVAAEYTDDFFNHY